MKKYSYLLVFLILVSSCKVKKQINGNHQLIYKLPDNAIKITDNQIKKDLDSFQMNKIVAFTNIYKIDNVLLFLPSDTIPRKTLPKTFLVDWKKGFDEWYANNMNTEFNEIFKPKLSKVKGYEVLRFRQKDRNLIYDRVHIVNKHRNGSFICVLYYKREDILTVQKTLDVFFNTLKF